MTVESEAAVLGVTFPGRWTAVSASKATSSSSSPAPCGRGMTVPATWRIRCWRDRVRYPVEGCRTGWLTGAETVEGAVVLTGGSPAWSSAV